VKKRAIGFRPPLKALPLVAQAPTERWATDLCRIWAGRNQRTTLALVIDCHTRELLGRDLSRGQGQDGGVGAGAGPDSPLPWPPLIGCIVNKQR
jgi:transposase InsO family protein